MIVIDAYLLLGIVVILLLHLTRRKNSPEEQRVRRELEHWPETFQAFAHTIGFCAAILVWPVLLVVRARSRLWGSQ